MKKLIKMKTDTQSQYIYTRSLFSSQELKLEPNEMLKISSFSLNKNNTSTVPLESINAKPSIRKSPNLYALSVALLSFITSILLYTCALNFGFFSTQLISALLLAISLTFFVFSWKNKSLIYTFYYKNTAISIFTLPRPSNNTLQVDNFVKLLTKKITHINEQNQHLYGLEALGLKLISKLDFLNNHGLMNDVTYQNIMDRIDHKINGTHEEQELAEVIKFPLVNMR